jgi:hypothetical protein
MTKAKRAAWRFVRLGGVGLAGVLLLGMGAGADKPPVPPALPAEGKPIASKDKPASAADPLAEPLALVEKARAAYAKVNDYSCTLVKREKIRDRLTPNHVIILKVRKAPFSVNMLWKEPKALEGQEVCYIEGKNEGNLRVKPSGLLGAIGFVSLEPDDERAKKTSNHRITNAGIGWLIEECGTGWEVERKLKQTKVRVGTYQYAKRLCTRVELLHPTSAGGKIRHHRNIVYFDQQTHLPIRVENYDWPKTTGDNGELVEVFSYVNLRVNVELANSVFNR